MYKNVYKWYDETPYNGLEQQVSEQFDMRDPGACKWDGSTNTVSGCPRFYPVHGYGFVQPLIHNPRMNQLDIDIWEPLFKRPAKLKFAGAGTRKGAKVFKYVHHDDVWKASTANAPFGMPASGAKFHQFPGDGML